jgi:drug/metabolite transporter (DMT)-like permease
MDAAPHLSRPLLALVIRLGAIAAVSTMAMLVKLASERGVHLMEILFWRQGTTLPVALAVALATGGLAQLGTSRPGTHALRAAYGVAGMILNFGAFILLPLAEATTFGFTAPIFAVILAVILLKDSVGIYRSTAVALGFAGVLVIAQPAGGHIPLLGAIVALGGAFMVALISIQISDLNKTDQPLSIVFWFAAVSTPFAALFLPFVATSHDPQTWLLLLAIGLVGTAGQFLLTAALRYGAVASVIVMDYSALIWATLYGWLIWDHLPPASTWLGVPLIVGAGLVISWREHVLSRRRLLQQIGD